MFWKLGTLRIKLNRDTLFKIQFLRIKYGVRRISNSSLASVGEMTAILMNLLKLHTHTHTPEHKRPFLKQYIVYW